MLGAQEDSPSLRSRVRRWDLVQALPLLLLRHEGPWPSLPYRRLVSSSAKQGSSILSREPRANQMGSCPRWQAHLAQCEPWVRGNVYCCSKNTGLSTKVPRAASRQGQVPGARRGWQEPASRPNQGSSLGPASPQWPGHLTGPREGKERGLAGSRASGPLTFVKQQLLQGLAPLEGFL